MDVSQTTGFMAAIEDYYQSYLHSHSLSSTIKFGIPRITDLLIKGFYNYKTFSSLSLRFHIAFYNYLRKPLCINLFDNYSITFLSSTRSRSCSGPGLSINKKSMRSAVSSDWIWKLGEYFLNYCELIKAPDSIVPIIEI